MCFLSVYYSKISHLKCIYLENHVPQINHLCSLPHLSVMLEGNSDPRSKNYLSGLEVNFVTYRNRGVLGLC